MIEGCEIREAQHEADGPPTDQEGNPPAWSTAPPAILKWPASLTASTRCWVSGTVPSL